MNARFWAWINCGWVKLTLRPGQTLSWHTYAPTEEGWTATAIRWEMEGGAVHREVFSDGSDCDGRLSSSWGTACRLDKLATGEGHDGTPIPEWEEGYAEQRDEYAEAAGY